MTTARAAKRHLTEEEYLQGELLSDVRHEYLGGDVYAMVGSSDRHNLITLNLATALRPQVRGGPCQLFMTDMKLRLETVGDIVVYYYPDLLLCCDPQDRATYHRTRPCLIVEVLSESTARVDRREKLFAYTALDSLQAYLLLSQERALAELHRRTAEGWRTQIIDSGEVPIDCLGVSVSLDLIYEDVPLPG